MFYLMAALMVALALAFVLVPLIRNRAGRIADIATNVSTEAANLEAFRLQRREIETEFDRGLMSQGARDEAMDELATRLACEVNVGEEISVEQPASAVTETRPPWLLGIVISIFIVVGTTLGYANWGNHNARAQTENIGATVGNAGEVSESGQVNANGTLPDKQVLALVEKLAKKMEENPTDPRGWILLARSQNALGQFAAAATAYARAAALTPGDAQLLADYADAQVMVQEGNFEGKPHDLIAQALKTDPSNMKALALAGTAEMRAGNKPAAIKHWEKLKTLVPKDSDDYAQVIAIITEIKTGKPAFSKESPSDQMTTAPRSTNTKAADSGVGKEVSGQINIADDMKTKLGKGDTLFIFARAVDGPKMPLAVLRVPAPSSWPFVFTLTDAMAMAPGMSLSSFPEVTIEARISKAGNAQPQPGDLQGGSRAIKPSVANVYVTINKVVP